MRIINVPIESLEERYSAQWNIWFPREFDELQVDYLTIYPEPLTDKIRDGSFLDVCGTNYFKASQLQILMKMLYNREITENDIIFIHDLWFPGIEMLQYVRQGLGINFKICGILHAGTYDPYDFVSTKGMGSWGKHLEESWFTFVDKIFVATHFHKSLILKSRSVNSNKIVVTGLPIYFSPGIGYQKKDIVVFPHRLDPEKNPQMFDQLKERFKDSNWQFIKTKEVCKTRNEYHNVLKQAKIAVSFSDQETWGIAQQEALSFGCFPVVPDKLSYQEMYDRRFRFKDFAGCCSKVIEFMRPNSQDCLERGENYLQLKIKGETAIQSMVKEMEIL